LREANIAFREAVRLKPDDFSAHVSLGAVLTDMRQFDQAVAECREAIRLKRDYAYNHFALGHALEAQGHQDEAMAAYREAIQLARYVHFLSGCCRKRAHMSGYEEEIKEIVARFQEAWREQGRADIAAFLPPPGVVVRFLAMHALIKVDLEARPRSMTAAVSANWNPRLTVSSASWPNCCWTSRCSRTSPKKVVTATQQRAAADHLEKAYGVSQRRASRVLGRSRSTLRYRRRQRSGEEALIAAVRRPAQRHPRYGYKRIGARLQRQGWRVNVKRVRRLWNALGLRRLPRRKKPERDDSLPAPASARELLPLRATGAKSMANEGLASFAAGRGGMLAGYFDFFRFCSSNSAAFSSRSSKTGRKSPLAKFGTVWPNSGASCSRSSATSWCKRTGLVGCFPASALVGTNTRWYESGGTFDVTGIRIPQQEKTKQALPATLCYRNPCSRIFHLIRRVTKLQCNPSLPKSWNVDIGLAGHRQP
jgi:putative transposase